MPGEPEDPEVAARRARGGARRAGRRRGAGFGRWLGGCLRLIQVLLMEEGLGADEPPELIGICVHELDGVCLRLAVSRQGDNVRGALAFGRRSRGLRRRTRSRSRRADYRVHIARELKVGDGLVCRCGSGRQYRQGARIEVDLVARDATADEIAAATGCGPDAGHGLPVKNGLGLLDGRDRQDHGDDRADHRQYQKQTPAPPKGTREVDGLHPSPAPRPLCPPCVSQPLYTVISHFRKQENAGCTGVDQAFR